MPSLVSILIPVYNCRKWVAQAIESALQQTWSNTEIIVLDDGSTDGSMEAIAPYREHIRIESSANSGQNVSRNRLTAMSHGEWLVYLDADDELAPDCIEKKMLLHADADAIYGTMERTWFLGTEKTRSAVHIAEEYPDPIVAAFWWRFPNTSSLMFRRTAVQGVGGFTPEYKNCTDYDIYFKLLIQGRRFRAAPESRTLYRQWSTSQAIYEDPKRACCTRLQVMWRAIRELEAKGILNGDQHESFGQAALGVIRMLYLHDPETACRKHVELLNWNSRLRPTAKSFTFLYRLGYRLLGFKRVEQVAIVARHLKHSWSSALGDKPKSRAVSP